MAENKAWLTGTEAVVSWYESMAEQDTPYYSVWDGRNLRFSYRGDSIEEGAKLLRQNLTMAEEQQSSGVLILKLHQELSKGQYLNERSPYSSSMPFRCISVENDALAVYNLSGMGALGRIDERLKKLEGGESKEGGIMGMLGGLLENPQVGPILAQAAVGAVFGIVNKVLPGVFPTPGGVGHVPAPQGPAIAGIPGEPVKDWDWAIEVLEKADPQLESDLIKLAELSQKNPSMFDFLIKNLRSM